jgi:hypothetical protein
MVICQPSSSAHDDISPDAWWFEFASEHDPESGNRFSEKIMLKQKDMRRVWFNAAKTDSGDTADHRWTAPAGMQVIFRGPPPIGTAVDHRGADITS